MVVTVVPPLSCAALLGQQKAKKLLSAAFASDRLAHGLLFTGPDGVGKSLFARGVAAAINCRQKKVDAPLAACGECDSCRKIAHGNHPDFQVVAPQNGVLKIARIRQLIKELEYPPYESVIRVVVLEDAHTMGREAANALLKTLEEPQAGNLLILTVDSTKPLLATISSRCQLVPFAALPLAAVTDILVKHGCGQDEAQLLALLSAGSPGAALQLQKKELVPLWQEIITFLLSAKAVTEEGLFTLLSIATQMAALKDDLPALLSLLRRWLRDMILEDRCSLALYCGDLTDDTGKYWNKEELSAKLRAVDQAERELARNCQRALVCEVLLFALQLRRR